MINKPPPDQSISIPGMMNFTPYQQMLDFTMQMCYLLHSGGAGRPARKWTEWQVQCWMSNNSKLCDRGFLSRVCCVCHVMNAYACCLCNNHSCRESEKIQCEAIQINSKHGELVGLLLGHEVFTRPCGCCWQPHHQFWSWAVWCSDSEP